MVAGRPLDSEGSGRKKSWRIARGIALWDARNGERRTNGWVEVSCSAVQRRHTNHLALRASRRHRRGRLDGEQGRGWSRPIHESSCRLAGWPLPCVSQSDDCAAARADASSKSRQGRRGPAHAVTGDSARWTPCKKARPGSSIIAAARFWPGTTDNAPEKPELGGHCSHCHTSAGGGTVRWPALSAAPAAGYYVLLCVDDASWLLCTGDVMRCDHAPLAWVLVCMSLPCLAAWREFPGKGSATV